jgi:hypothetical protein
VPSHRHLGHASLPLPRSPLPKGDAATALLLRCRPRTRPRESPGHCSSGVWRVLDPVPSPNNRSVALVEYGCHGSATQSEVRDLATGRSDHLVTRQLSQCGLESDVTWAPTSTKLVFAYGQHLNPARPPRRVRARHRHGESHDETGEVGDDPLAGVVRV